MFTVAMLPVAATAGIAVVSGETGVRIIGLVRVNTNISGVRENGADL